MKKDNNITNYIGRKPKRSISNLKNNRKGDTKYMVNIEELKTHLEEYLPEVTTVSNGKIKECPLCKSGSGKNKTCAFSIVPNTNQTKWKCFSCNNGGTIIDLYAKLHNIDDKTAIKELSKKYGNTPIQRKTMQKNNFHEKEFTQNKAIEDIRLAQTFTDSSAYMFRRSISPEVLQRFHVGFIPNWIHPNILYKQQFGTDEEKKKYSHVQGTPRVIIPTSNNSYLSRDIRPTNEIPVIAQKYAKMKVGETHILNIEALKTNRIVMAVEGEIDALSFITLGYETIGLGSTSMINQFIEKQYYEIIGECSKAERPILIWALDNDETGRKATSNALRLCKIHNIPCICVDRNFYGQFKDGNEMMINNRQGLIENINKAIEQAKSFDFSNIEEETNQNVEIPDDADYIIEEYDQRKRKTILKISAPLLAEYIRTHSNYIFVRNDALEGVTRYWYENGVYKLISDDELKGHIKSYITRVDKSILKKKDVEEVFFDLTTDLNYISHDKLNANEDIINFKNGLLNLKTMELMPHSPQVYSTIQLDCNYNPDALDSPTFDKYLEDFTQGNPQKKQFIMEYMGGTFSNVFGFRFKRALFMVGDGNTGKSTLKRFSENVIGSKYVSSATLEQLEARFGGTYIHNKRLIGSNDMPHASIRALDMFKALTGGDSISIEYKCKNIFSETFKGFLWFTMNKLPKLSGNQGEEVYNRIIVFRCNNVIPEEQQDKNLDNKLLEEKESIINKCLIAFKKAIDNNYTFSVPEDSITEKTQYQEENNPVAMFYKECCVDRPTGTLDNCTTKKTYDVFKAWCMDNNNGYTISNIEFRKELLNIFKAQNIKDIIIRRKTGRYYIFTLSRETKLDYTKIYGYDNSNINSY